MAGREPGNVPEGLAARERRAAKECLSYLYRGNGGPYTREEARQIMADVMGLADHEAHLHKMGAHLCRQMIVRFIVLGLA